MAFDKHGNQVRLDNTDFDFGRKVIKTLKKIKDNPNDKDIDKNALGAWIAKLNQKSDDDLYKEIKIELNKEKSNLLPKPSNFLKGLFFSSAFDIIKKLADEYDNKTKDAAHWFKREVRSG